MVFCDGGVIDVVPIGGGASWVVLLGCCAVGFGAFWGGVFVVVVLSCGGVW